jgi:hypothetical protein
MMAETQLCWQKNTTLAWREIDGETVIISPEESVLHELNETGSFIWQRVDGKRSVADIAELLVVEYNVTREEALADTEALLAQLASRKLLIPVEEANLKVAADD